MLYFRFDTRLFKLFAYMSFLQVLYVFLCVFGCYVVRSIVVCMFVFLLCPCCRSSLFVSFTVLRVCVSSFIFKYCLFVVVFLKMYFHCVPFHLLFGVSFLFVLLLSLYISSFFFVILYCFVFVLLVCLLLHMFILFIRFCYLFVYTNTWIMSFVLFICVRIGPGG